MADQPDQEDTLRSPKYYHQNKRKQIQQHGEDELAPEPEGRDARGAPEKQRQNREKMGVNEEHQTKKMEQKHRRTFP